MAHTEGTAMAKPSKDMRERAGSIIVSRHAGALEWLRRQGIDVTDARASVTPDDVRGKHVIGNLPFHLAALAAVVEVIEFSGPAPRGAEYTAEQMDAAGARLRRYRVVALDEGAA